jgi:5-hydroxyisourate hydrolase
MSGITTHVLDTAAGHPARGVAITLEIADGDGWREVGRGATDDDGRLKSLTDGHQLEVATYRISFDTGAYYAGSGQSTFYPRVQVQFAVAAADQHYHVPILLSPFGFTTYRGS